MGANLKTIALSDLHLGYDGSDGITRSLLAKPLPSQPMDPAALRLKEIVAKFADGQSVDLIGVGDIFDLSMCSDEDIARDVRFLFGVTLPPVRHVDIIRGNHDNHLFVAQREMLQTFDESRRPIICPAQIAHALYGSINGGCAVFSPDYALTTASGEHVYFIHGDLMDSPTNLLARALLPVSVTGRQYALAAAALGDPVNELVYWSLGEMGLGYGKEGLLTELYYDLRLGKESAVCEMVKQWVKNYDSALPDTIAGVVASVIVELLLKAVGQAQLGASTSRYCNTDSARTRIKAWLDRIGFDCSKRSHVLTGHTHVSDLYHFDQAACYNLGSWLSEPGHAVPDAMVAMFDTDEIPFKVRWERCVD